jgi:hypothetical protein
LPVCNPVIFFHRIVLLQMTRKSIAGLPNTTPDDTGASAVADKKSLRISRPPNHKPGRARAARRGHYLSPV